MNETKVVFQRKLYNRMLQWKQEEQGQTALLIEGVRRVGKSTLAELFAKKEYFLLSRGNKLCPLEVKSSGYKTHASLDAFQEKFSARILHRYLVYTKDLAKEQDVLMLPVFMVGQI